MKYLACIVGGVLIGFLIFYLLFRSANKRQYIKKKQENGEKRRFKPNFTKAVLVAVMSTYFVGLLIGIRATLLDSGQFAVLATYIATPTTTVIALYCWKAKAENMVKIKQGYPEETKDIPIDLNNITNL